MVRLVTHSTRRGKPCAALEMLQAEAASFSSAPCDGASCSPSPPRGSALVSKASTGQPVPLRLKRKVLF